MHFNSSMAVHRGKTIWIANGYFGFCTATVQQSLGFSLAFTLPRTVQKLPTKEGNWDSWQVQTLVSRCSAGQVVNPARKPWGLCGREGIFCTNPPTATHCLSQDSRTLRSPNSRHARLRRIGFLSLKWKTLSKAFPWTRVRYGHPHGVYLPFPRPMWVSHVCVSTVYIGISSNDNAQMGLCMWAALVSGLFPELNRFRTCLSDSSWENEWTSHLFSRNLWIV